MAEDDSEHYDAEVFIKTRARDKKREYKIKPDKMEKKIVSFLSHIQVKCFLFYVLIN